ncbi:MAG: alkaline phosphatase D family protein [Pseudomonadota bacterium]|nr:alkaline phosphatase D family protein [Pseudomonadota bacterium]
MNSKTLITLILIAAACSVAVKVDKKQGNVSLPDKGSADAAGALAIMQGATNSNQTQLIVLTEKSRTYRYTLREIDSTTVINPSSSSTNDRQSQRWALTRMTYKGLKPATEYQLQVYAAATDDLLDSRRLRTLNPDRQDLKFAFTSCMLDTYRQDDIWEQMVALNPDVIFLIGDNVYTDAIIKNPTPADIWRRNFETRSRINLFRNKNLIPIVAVWDDHDYGKNNEGKDYPHKAESLAVFKEFFAGEKNENYYMPGFGAASSFNIYGYQFFLMDNRTYRTKRWASPDRHFGDQQMDWLLTSLAEHEHAFIISGDQFFGGYSIKDSFQGHHPKRFKYFLEQLKSLPTAAVFLSGDRHYTEVMAIPALLLGYQSYEFTASPAHKDPRSFPTFFPNPLRIAGKEKRRNFMLMRANAAANGLNLQATSYSVGGEVLFSGSYLVNR